VFYGDGRVAGGPPPEPLTKLDVRVNNGQVEIYTRGVPITGGALQPGG
jgi:menaquinol-cytochrome c reductase iron-sulfur subunit